MSIKPITTQYRGIRFRSRLEARWAVFFDRCGFLWEYEAEGFDIDGIYYLPDFRLHNVLTRSGYPEDGDKVWEDMNLSTLYVEVKGEMDDDSREKIWAFSKYHPLYVVQDIPHWEGEYAVDYLDVLTKFWKLDQLYYAYDTVDEDGYVAGIFVNNQGNPALAGPDHDLSNMDVKRTFSAFNEARSARFERGKRSDSSNI